MAIPLLIGEQPQATQVKTYNVIRPATQTSVHQVVSASLSDINSAISICHSALPSWSATPLQSRCDIVRKAAALLKNPQSGWKERMRSANLLETSVPPWWISQQLEDVPRFMTTLADSAEEALAPWTVDGSASTTRITREPYGVCLAMAAWNAVPMLTSRAVVTPLIAGNTVMLKTSEVTPHSQSLWAELLYAAGLPRKTLCVIHMSIKDAPTLIPSLVDHRLVRHVNFTGSTRVGSIIAGLAGKALKPCIMELGGKCPVLLLPDADVEVAASHIIFGTMMNAGQVCMSTERIIVPYSQYDRLCDALRAAWDTVNSKGSRALFTESAAKRVHDLVDAAVSQGLSPILNSPSGKPPTDHSRVTPEIYGPATPDMRIYAEETFGPVSVIIPVQDSDQSQSEVLEEMVRIANSSDYGLSASVWSADVNQATSVAARLESGAVHINGPVGLIPSVKIHKFMLDLPGSPGCSSWGVEELWLGEIQRRGGVTELHPDEIR